MAIATTIVSSSENIPHVECSPPDDPNDPMLIRRRHDNSDSNSSSNSGTNSRQDQPSGSSITAVASATEQIQSKNTFTLEFPVLLLFFSWNLSGTVFQNQVLYQTCMLTYNKTVCSRLTDEEIDEVIWQNKSKEASATVCCVHGNEFLS